MKQPRPNTEGQNSGRNAIVSALCLILMLLIGLPAAATAPVAGQQIENTASLLYQDAATGLVSKLNSNVVRLSVAAQESLTLTQDQTILQGPGSSVVFSHRLTNTGNVTSSFAVTAVNLSGDDFDLSPLTVYLDSNGNGSIDPGEPVIPAGGPVVLAPGASASLVVVSAVPIAVPAGKSALVTITAISAAQGVSATNKDTVNTNRTASVQLTKSASNLTPNPNDEVTFTLVLINNGYGAAGGVNAMVNGNPTSLLIVRDSIPANTVFSGISNTGGGTALYHLRGVPDTEYKTVPPASLDQVDAIAFGFPNVAVGQAASASFKVRVNDNASGSVFNTAQALYNDGTADQTANSNRVQLSVPTTVPVIHFYTSNAYGQVASIGRLGSPVFVQASAAACNLDPNVAETHPIRITSLRTGDSELFTATESAPNSGIFRILPQAPTADASTVPAAASDGTVTAAKNDVLSATITGCSPNPASTSLLIDPSGVVFDSRSDAPLAGVTLTLIDVSGGGNGGHPGDLAKVLAADGVSSAPSTLTTDAQGRFQFPVVAPGTYRLMLTPVNGYSFPSQRPAGLLPADRVINTPGSFGGNFQVSADTPTVMLDVPIDPAAIAGLFVDKAASRGTAEIGDFVDYTVTVKNNTGYSLTQVTVNDHLPPGFVLQPGSVRLDKAAISGASASGRDLAFNIGAMAINSQVTLTYRVQIGPGAAQGDGVNRASAHADRADSNTASAKVVVTAGVFSDRGFITGKVFADCNGNGLQDKGEVGIPGVRLYLDDGTFVITDSEGKYSLYGVSSHLHVMRIDQTTLPAGARPSYLSSRDAGDGGTRFIDIYNGELFRADFPMYACSDAMLSQISIRRRKAEAGSDESARILQGQFLPEQPVQSESTIKSLPASGIIGSGSNAPAPAAAASAMAASNSALPRLEALPAEPAAPIIADSPAAPAAGDFVPADNNLGFVDFKDQDVVPFTQTDIRVKGNSAAMILMLKVNGAEVPPSRVGKKTIYSNKQAAVWEYIGVALRPGANQVTLTEIDSFGNPRTSQTIHLIAPNKLGKLHVEVPPTAYADGVTPIPVKISLTDANNVPVTVRTPITLDSSAGKWLVKDANEKEKGVQVFIEGGSATFELLPPQEPGDSTIRALSGDESAEVKMSFLPELRPMIALGSTEQVISFSHQSGSAGASLGGFQDDLDRLSAGSSNGTSFSSHTGLLMKGKVGESSLLTLSYDSDKSNNETLFRDIQPDNFYPVYGDSSVRGYDAQSTSPLYLRFDHGKSYSLLGDYTTQDANNPARVLSNYSRSMTGVREHVELGRYSFTAYGSHESMTQGVEEIRANGTSGPFYLSHANVAANSEIVELLTRDRNQNAVVLSDVPQTRFSDYQFDPVTGELLFKSPIASFDSELNPIYIRITYDYDQGGPKFMVAGGEGQVKLNQHLALGGVFVSDQNPANRSQLRGVNTTVTLGEKTQFVAEMAQTQADLTGTGNGYRMEFDHKDSRLDTKMFAGRTDADFANSSALLSQGRGESGAHVSYKLNDQTRLVGDTVYTEDVSTSNATRMGALFGLQHSFQNHMQMEVGVRHTINPNPTATTSITPAGATTAAPDSMTTLRGKLSMQVPGLAQVSLFSEYEQDVANMDDRMLAVGGSYQLSDRGRLYVRHELISSLGSIYDLNSSQQTSATVVGIDTTYHRDAHLFSEFRGNDAFSGRETEAAIGLRNGWKLADGFRVNTTLENVKTLSGSNLDNSIAVTGAVEYTANPLWKGSARLELRGGSTSNSLLSTVGIAAKMAENWTFLSRGLVNRTTFKGTSIGDSNQNRLQFGFAYRDTDTNQFSLLSMLELKSEADHNSVVLPTTDRVLVFSTNANYQPYRVMVLSARYAGKLLSDGSNDLESQSHTHLLSGRVTVDVSKRWDVGFATSSLFSRDFGTRQYGMGGELGYRVARNLWLSGGYNILGFEDRDLAGDDATRRGPYMRLRFKFDENLFHHRSETAQVAKNGEGQ